MKTKHKLAISLGLLAAPFALLAETSESAYVASYRGRRDIPAPVSVVMPSVSHRYVGQTVTVRFVVDTAGQVKLLALPPTGVDPELAAAVTAAITQWKFSPALVDGHPVAKRVELPLIIGDENSPL